MSEERSSICESQSDWLGGSQTEEVSEMIRYSEKGDFDLPLSCWTHIPFQALCPREPKMRSPCPRKYWRRRGRGKQTARCHLNIHPLMVQQIHAARRWCLRPHPSQELALEQPPADAKIPLPC